MKTLLVLSDLWGTPKSDWVHQYTKLLNEKYNVEYIDCTVLAELDLSDYTQEALHQQFVNGGIDRAVQNLKSKITTEVHILAFSVGGTIGWQCALITPFIQKLVCVSSTRLRKEVQKPTCETVLFFGEQDAFAPKTAWFEGMKLVPTLLENKTHDMYKESQVASRVATVL